MMDDTPSDARSPHDVGRRSNRSHDLAASLTRLESTVAGMRRRNTLLACWGVIVIAATAGFDMWMLGAEAASVMALRTARIAAGGSAGMAEAELMVTEKVRAAIELQTRLMTGALGHTKALPPQGRRRQQAIEPPVERPE